jgi:hypothetical protein
VVVTASGNTHAQAPHAAATGTQARAAHVTVARANSMTKRHSSPVSESEFEASVSHHRDQPEYQAESSETRLLLHVVGRLRFWQQALPTARSSSVASNPVACCPCRSSRGLGMHVIRAGCIAELHKADGARAVLRNEPGALIAPEPRPRSWRRAMGMAGTRISQGVRVDVKQRASIASGKSGSLRRAGWASN